MKAVMGVGVTVARPSTVHLGLGAVELEGCMLNRVHTVGRHCEMQETSKVGLDCRLLPRECPDRKKNTAL